MANDKPIDFQLYRYSPSLAAAVLFTILFGVCTCLHGWEIIRKRTWYFIPLLIGAIFETIGYIGRALSNSNPKALSPYIMQSLTILLAPALMAATIYMVLGRTIVLLRAEHHSLVRVKWLTKLFVGCDVFSFLTQSSGGGIMASGTQSGMHTGQMLIIAGLALQLAFFGFFVVVAGIFHFRVERDPTTTMLNMERGESSGGRRRSWRTVLWTLYTVSLIILVRATFRLVEYAGGNDGYLISHEIFLYIFDALFMFAVLVILFIFHPAAVVSGEKRAGDRLQLT